MALQRVFRHLREETGLVDLYVLRLLHTVALALRASRSDPPGFGTTNILSRLVDAFVKVCRTVAPRQKASKAPHAK